jgi:hypothetical protein
MCQRENPVLDRPLDGVVRDLDALNAPGTHHLFEFVERSGAVVRRPQQANPARVFLFFHPVEMLSPRREVVNLLDVDAPVVEIELAFELVTTLLLRVGPYLCGDQRVVAAAAQRLAEDRFGPPVHRRGID